MGGQGGNDTNLNNYLLLDIVHALIALSLILSQNKISDANPEVEITIGITKR